MNGGQTASNIAYKTILDTLENTPAENWGPDTVKKSVEAANMAVYDKALAEPQLRGMGTTTTVLMLTPEAAYVTHVGDSRIYQLRKGKKYFRTFDHSKVFEMVALNMMTEEQARQSSFSNIITRALGIRKDVDFTVGKLPYKRGDRFILCSDGIWNCRPEPEMIEIFTACEDTRKQVVYMTEKVNKYGMEAGGDHDNLTAVVVDILEDSEYQYSLLMRLRMFFGRIVLGLKKKFKKKPYKKS